MTTLRLRHVFAAALAVCLLALGATDAHATHFRYGTLRWERLTETADTVTIKVTHESAWRFNYEGWTSTPTVGVPLTIPTNPSGALTVQRLSGGAALFPARPLVIIPSFVNPATNENWFVGSGQEIYTIQKLDLPVRIFWTGQARLSNLQDGNADDSYRVESVMSATPNAASPAASILPIITVGYPSPAATFFIPAGDVEGDTMTWSISPQSRSLLTKIAPDGQDNAPPATLTINSLTGEVTWNTGEEAPPPIGGSHFYSVQFMVTDSKGGETPVDALLQLIRTVPNPPVALIDDSPDQHLVSVRPNNPVTFTLKGVDNDAGATVTLTSGNVPLGATMTPSLPTVGTSPRSSVFNWTPTLAEAGNNHTIQFAVTDEFGNQDTNSAVVTVLENFLPTVTCPDETIAEATGPLGADNVTLEADVFDRDPQVLTVRWFVDGTLVKTETVPAGPEPGPTQAQVSLTHSYAFLPSPHEILVEVDDGQAPTQSCTSTVKVVDTTKPVITNNPGNLVREATGPSGAAVSWDPLIATDTVDPNVPVICAPVSGSTFAITPPAPVVTVTCTATDDSGNIATATFTVRVEDTLAPVISGYGNITATGVGGAIVTWPPPTAVDIVDGIRPVTCLPVSGSFFPLGSTPVICTASDTRNNTATITFTVTVIPGDTKPPKVCLKLNPGTLWPPNHKMRTIQVILKVTDNEDPTPTCTITNVTSSEPVTGPRYGNTTPDWIFSGLNLQLRAERYSKHGRTYTVTVVCRDDAGNATTTKGTVRVPHDQGHRLLDGDQNTNNPNQSGQCCTRPRPDNDEDDDDDDAHFWTNDPDKAAGFGHNNPCPRPDMDDDDDDHGDDDDDHLTIKADPTGTN